MCSVSSPVGHPRSQTRMYKSSQGSHQTESSRPFQVVNAPCAQRGTHNSNLTLATDV
jgi:hypothetical protein